MNSKQLIKFFLLPIIMFILTGCFEIKQEIWINGDGSGRMEVETTVFPIGKKSAMEDLLNKSLQELSKTKNKIEKNENVKKYNIISQIENDGTIHVKQIIEIYDITKISKIYKDVNGTPGSNSEKGKNTSSINIIRTKNNTLKFEQTFSKKNSGTDDSAGMLKTMFANRYITIVVHGDILSSNGTIHINNEKGEKYVKWKIPIAKTMEENIGLSATIKCNSNFIFMKYLVIATIVILIFILFFFLKRKNKNNQKRIIKDILTTLEFRCSNCNQSLEAEIEMQGEKVQCPSCDSTIKVATQKKILVKKTKSFPYKTIIVILILILLSIIFFPFNNKNQESGKLNRDGVNPETISMQNNNPEKNSQILSPEAILKKYWYVSKWEDRIAYVYNPEETMDFMKRKYKNSDFPTNIKISIIKKYELKTEKYGEVVKLVVETTGVESTDKSLLTYYLTKQNNDYKIIWEPSVGYNFMRMPILKLMHTMPKTPIIYYTFGKLTTYKNYYFLLNEKAKYSFLGIELHSEPTIYAFANIKRFPELLDKIADGKYHKMAIGLSYNYPNDKDGSITMVESIIVDEYIKTINEKQIY